MYISIHDKTVVKKFLENMSHVTFSFLPEIVNTTDFIWIKENYFELCGTPYGDFKVKIEDVDMTFYSCNEFYLQISLPNGTFGVKIAPALSVK